MDRFADFFADHGLTQALPAAADVLTNSLLPGRIPTSERRRPLGRSDASRRLAIRGDPCAFRDGRGAFCALWPDAVAARHVDRA